MQQVVMGVKNPFKKENTGNVFTKSFWQRHHEKIVSVDNVLAKKDILTISTGKSGWSMCEDQKNAVNRWIFDLLDKGEPNYYHYTNNQVREAELCLNGKNIRLIGLMFDDFSHLFSILHKEDAVSFIQTAITFYKWDDLTVALVKQMAGRQDPRWDSLWNDLAKKMAGLLKYARGEIYLTLLIRNFPPKMQPELFETAILKSDSKSIQSRALGELSEAKDVRLSDSVWACAFLRMKFAILRNMKDVDYDYFETTELISRIGVFPPQYRKELIEDVLDFTLGEITSGNGSWRWLGRAVSVINELRGLGRTYQTDYLWLKAKKIVAKGLENRRKVALGAFSWLPERFQTREMCTIALYLSMDCLNRIDNGQYHYEKEALRALATKKVKHNKLAEIAWRQEVDEELVHHLFGSFGYGELVGFAKEIDHDKFWGIVMKELGGAINNDKLNDERRAELIHLVEELPPKFRRQFQASVKPN